ncbi:hypothetical protein [Mesorhizobium sp. ANAO-SY3R2]|uniref:hypothetical protein n=1 Tax=Mesorhizobium sp. ANAO-SY3R2 TaxID=3166644 RepID=UPI00366BFEB4
MLAAAMMALTALPAQAGEITQAGPGCLDRSYAEKLFTHRDVTRDPAAAGAMIDDGIRSGSCRVFKIGEQVEIESKSTFGLSCVKPTGSGRCFWVSPTMAE